MDETKREAELLAKVRKRLYATSRASILVEAKRSGYDTFKRVEYLLEQIDEAFERPPAHSSYHVQKR